MPWRATSSQPAPLNVADTLPSPRRADTPLVGGSLFALPGSDASPLRAKARSRALQSIAVPSASGAAFARPATLDEPSVALRPGATIEGTPYRIDRWLGEGSMGTVYEGVHVEIERRVALKILHPRTSASVGPSNFRDEARASARINAPNIVEVYDFKTLSDGRELIAMEYLDGAPLSAFEGQAMDPSRALGILRQICRGLSAAHRVGLLHRDVKPDNVMLITREGRRDFVKIVDFGLSSALEDNATGAVVGTPRYMAPEIIQHLPADQRTDMYSLGCVAYELITGQAPFETEDLHDLLTQHLFDEPAPPSDLVGLDVCPASLDRVILRCLAKAPQDRFADMSDLEAALLEAQLAADLTTSWDDLPIPDVDDSRREQILAAMPDNITLKRSNGWIAAALAVVVGVAVWALWPQPEVSPENEIIVVEEALSTVDVLSSAAHVAAGRAYYIYPQLGDAKRVTAYRHVLELEELLGEHAGEGQRRAKLLRQEFSTTLTRLGDTFWARDGGKRFAIDYYIQALLFDRENERARERAGITMGELSWLHQRAATGEFTEAELIAAEFLQALAEPDTQTRATKLREFRSKRKRRPKVVRDQTEAELVAELGDVEVELPDVDTPESAPEDPAELPEDSGTTGRASPEPSADTDDERPVKPDPARAKALVAEADGARKTGDWKTAERRYVAALELDEDNATAYAGLGDLAFQRGHYNKAVKYTRKAVRYDPQNAELRLRLGDSLFKVMRMSEARTQYEKAAELGSDKAERRLAKVLEKLGGDAA